MSFGRLPDLTILSGQTESGSISMQQLRHCKAIAIQGPATLPEATVVQVTIDGSTWSTLQDGGSDVAVTAGDTTVIFPTPFAGLRLSAATTAADRTFLVAGEY